MDFAALALRLVVGAIFVAQGYRKVLQPADAPHGRANLARLIRSGGLSAAGELALLVGVTELGAGVFVLAGLLTRLTALALVVIMLVAIIRFKWTAGFLGGWDWPFSVFGSCLALVLMGAGQYSLDAVLHLSL